MFWAIVWQTFTILRRDRIFIPVIIGGIVVLFLISLAGDLSIEHPKDVLYEMGLAATFVLGSVVAVLWGAKMVADSRAEGAINLQLAAPIPRWSWIGAKFCGLAIALAALAVIVILMWSTVNYLFLYTQVQASHVIIIAMQLVSWWVLAALAVLFSSFSSATVTTFVVAACFVVGMISEPAAQVLGSNSESWSQYLVHGIATVWNLHIYDFRVYADGQALPWTEIAWSLLQGVATIALFLSLAMTSFENKDLV